MIGTLRQTWAEAWSLGLRTALHSLTYRSLRRLAGSMVFKGMIITEVDPAFLGEDGLYRYQFLDADSLKAFAEDPQYDMTPEFVAAALNKGDECYGILDGSILASYGWYATEPTPVADDLVLHFAKEYRYMYKGYTHPKYRGRRLHAIGMTRALQAYQERAYKGLISYVESNNYSSLKSVYRMGYVDFGRIYVARIFGRYYLWATPGCRAFGFELRSGPATTSTQHEESVETLLTSAGP